jgi:hypothetical protein
MMVVLLLSCIGFHAVHGVRMGEAWHPGPIHALDDSEGFSDGSEDEPPLADDPEGIAEWATLNMGTGDSDSELPALIGEESGSDNDAGALPGTRGCASTPPSQRAVPAQEFLDGRLRFH